MPHHKRFADRADDQSKPRGGRKRRSGCLSMSLGFLTLCLAAAAGIWHWVSSQPERYVNPDWVGQEKPVFYRGDRLDHSALDSGEALKLALTDLQKLIDPGLVYEEASKSVILTTKDKVIRMQTDQLTATVNDKPFELQYPAVVQDEDVYVPLAPIAEWYGLSWKEHDRTGAVRLFKAGDVLQKGQVRTDENKPERVFRLREAPGKREAILADVPQGTELHIWGEENGWYRVQMDNGYIGYMNKSDVVLSGTETVPPVKTEAPKTPWKPTGGKIVMAWEHVVNKNPDTKSIPAMAGVNVVSPTWFHLKDGQGNLTNKADPAYVQWARGRGLQVWALFSNSFDPAITSEALATYDKRMKMIRQLLAFAQTYKLQGINIDFENVNLSDKDRLTQFVREMAPLLREQGLVVSIDVTVKDGSDNWSRFLDRPALAEAVDYMMVMAYDEHWASSPKSGSVSSLGWTESKGIVQLLEEDGIPPSKLVLGVPFYTRIWTEKPDAGGKVKVSSKAVGMETVRKLLADKGLKPVFLPDIGQNYVEYEENGALNRIWIEDEVSMTARAELVRKYDLAGIAAWRRGFEIPDIWGVIEETLKEKP
jgi:spore germination protein YaaH